MQQLFRLFSFIFLFCSIITPTMSFSALDALVGDYTLVEVNQDNTAVMLPSQYTLRVAKEENDDKNFRLSIKVGNSMGARLQVVANTEEKKGEWEATVSRTMSTKMMVPPDVGAVEKALGAVWPATQRLKLQHHQLTFETAGSDSIVFRRTSASA